MGKEKTTPICKICKEQYPNDKFDSSAWIQFYLKEDHPELLWICPECSEAIGFKKNFDDLIRLQNACAEIKLAGETGTQCGH